MMLIPPQIFALVGSSRKNNKSHQKPYLSYYLVPQVFCVILNKTKTSVRKRIAGVLTSGRTRWSLKPISINIFYKNLKIIPKSKLMSNLSRLSTLWIVLYWYFYMCMFVYRCRDGRRDLIYGFNTISFQLTGIGH